MTSLAFFGYLFVFYLLPWHGTVLYQWVWVDAPRRFPRLAVTDGRHVVFNGAFYLEMWLWWLGCLAVASLLEAASRRDDPAWAGLFGGLTRGLGRVYALLTLLCLALVIVAAANGFAVHGPLSLLVALLTALLLSASSPAARAARRRAPAVSPDGTPTAPAPPDTLPTEARVLRADDFPPFDPDALARRVVQAVSPPGASAPIFREFDVPPASMEGETPPPARFTLLLPPSAYLAELGLPRPTSPAQTAAALMDAAQSPVLRRAAARLTDGGDARACLHRVLAFAASLPDATAPDDAVRLPLQVLHDGAATPAEKAWLAAALLRASGVQTALWHPTSGGADAIAVTDVYDPSSGEQGGAVLRVPGGPAWFVFRPGSPAPDPSQGSLYELTSRTSDSLSTVH